ncbi:MAG: PA2779 family protein [Bacteriovorax sp.]|nr:PA2779 family protein [Bacteriovorax sp.]
MRLHLSLLLIVALLSFSVHSAETNLSMLPTMDVVEEVSSLQSREDFITYIKNEDVQKYLIKLGVDPKEALNRVSSLSNAEIKDLSNQIKKAQAGGDFGVGGLIGALVFIFIVLLITDIVGLTKFFSFTRSIRS